MALEIWFQPIVWLQLSVRSLRRLSSIIQDAKERGSLIDATYGRRTRAVIVTDSDHVILSAVQPETVANRLNDRDEDLAGDEELDDDE